MNDLISVIVPIYNPPINLLCRSIESILRQSYANIEVLLIDDGSNHDVYEECEKYVGMDNRIKCFHKMNGGVSSARNQGLNMANGKYIVFVDCDDTVDFNMIEKMYCTQKKNNLDLVVCACNYISKDKGDSTIKKEISCIKIYEKKETLDILYYLKKPYDGIEMTAVWGKLYDYDKINGLRFDEKMTIGEDFKFNYCYIKNAEHIGVISDKCYNYYINENGAMHSEYKPQMINNIFALKNMIAEEPKNIGLISRCVNIALVIMLMIDDKTMLIEDYKIICTLIKKYRFVSIMNVKSRNKVRIALIVSYLGFGNVSKIFKFMEKVK